MRETKAARNSGNYSTPKASAQQQTTTILQDAALGVLGALLIVGIPFIMAALKSLGAW